MMNSQISEARRKILLNFKNKYSAASLKRYDKTFSSDDSLDISDDDENYSKIISVNEHEKLVDKQTGDTFENKKFSSENLLKKTSLERIETEDSNKVVIECKLVADDTKSEALKSGVNSESLISVITNEEIDEVFSEESDASSINDHFANIHLVSDDILDEIVSTGDSDSIKEELNTTGGRSAAQSIKSLQLGSPIEPPNFDYDYESDFEASGENSESSSSVASEVIKNDVDYDLNKSNDRLFLQQPVNDNENNKVHIHRNLDKSYDEHVPLKYLTEDSKTNILRTSSNDETVTNNHVPINNINSTRDVTSNLVLNLEDLSNDLDEEIERSSSNSESSELQSIKSDKSLANIDSYESEINLDTSYIRYSSLNSETTKRTRRSDKPSHINKNNSDYLERIFDINKDDFTESKKIAKSFRTRNSSTRNSNNNSSIGSNSGENKIIKDVKIVKSSSKSAKKLKSYNKSATNSCSTSQSTKKSSLSKLSLTKSAEFAKNSSSSNKYSIKLSDGSYDSNEIKKSSKEKKHKNNVGINVNLKSKKLINKSAQTIKREYFISPSTKQNETFNLKSSLKNKLYINTNVRSGKHRPMVKSSKLIRISPTADNPMDCNPYLISTQDSTLPLNKFVDEIVRNQISSTRQYIDCHHRLYMDCCQTVKSLNDKYTKSRTTVLIP